MCYISTIYEFRVTEKCYYRKQSSPKKNVKTRK